jgi:DNA-binding NtrC family response regulator
MSKEFTSLAALVIDDEPLIRWALSEALAEAGHAVLSAPDGAGGLLAVMRAPQAFDFVFLDTPQSAVVLMTASGTKEMVAEAYRLGVYRVLNKPFDLAEVHNVVAAGVGRLKDPRR